MHAFDASEHLELFIEQHSLRETEAISREKLAIGWARESQVVIQQAFVKFTESELERFPASGMILHLLHRAFEHFEASVVAFTTGSATSSEALSRAAAELSTSIQFILEGQPESRLLAYLEHYVINERKRLKHWSRTVEFAAESSKNVHLERIELRTGAVESIESVVNLLEQSLRSSGVPLHKERWPDVASRFEATDDSVGYRTYYARMSGQVHSDAEETIRYFVSRVGEDGAFLERMATETVMFSRLMLYIALGSFLTASSRYARYHRMQSAERVIEEGRVIIDRESQVIARELESI